VEIRINEKKIDFTLEEEKTLGEVLLGIRSWLGDSGFLVSSIEKNGESLDLYDSAAWESSSVDETEVLDLTILSGPQQYVVNLHTVYQYIALLQRSIASGNGEILRQLKEEHGFVAANLDALLGAEGYGARLLFLLQASGVEKADMKPQVQQLLSFCKNLSLILEGRIREATHPFEELKSAAAGLNTLVPQLLEVPVLLQTGKDETAMGFVIEFTEFSDKLIRINHILKEQKLLDFSDITVEHQRFDAFYEEFNGILRELLEAFDSQDSVLIGDLIEYEVVPRTEKLNAYIGAIEATVKEAPKES
jgi:hypothetical protein